MANGIQWPALWSPSWSNRVAEAINALETERLSERILSGLAEARRRGKQLKHPKSLMKQRGQHLPDHVMVVKDLKRGLCIR